MSRTYSFFFCLLALSALLCVAVGSAQPQQRTVFADHFPGADLGAKVNAADHALGSAPGEIVVSGGGTIATPIVVSERHTLRLRPGTYASTSTGIPILLKPGAS